MRVLVTNPDILDAKDVGLLLRLDSTTVLKYTRQGHIPGKKIGSVYRYSREEIEKLMPGSVESSPRGSSEQTGESGEAEPLQTGTY